MAAPLSKAYRLHRRSAAMQTIRLEKGSGEFAPLTTASFFLQHEASLFSECPLWVISGQTVPGIQFHSASKCCTYIPDLPNYLIGAIFRDPDPGFAEMKAVVKRELQSHLIVTPLGANSPDEYSAVYARNVDSFGQNVSLRCPFYVEATGGCGIWNHRNSTCTTWFCRFVRGSVGVIFWKYVDQLLGGLEKVLTDWCILNLGFGPDDLQLLFPPQPTGRNLTVLQATWGPWKGREMEFFKECSLMVEALSWQEVLALGGTETHINARLTHLSYQKLMSKEVQPFLRAGVWKNIKQVNENVYRIWSYNRYDPFDLPRSVLDALPYFNGRVTNEVVRTIEQERGLNLEASYIRKLTDFGVLVPIKN